MKHLSMPTTSAFFRGQIAAQQGKPAPQTPAPDASFQEQLFYRGYMKEIKKVQPAGDNTETLSPA